MRLRLLLCIAMVQALYGCKILRPTSNTWHYPHRHFIISSPFITFVPKHKKLSYMKIITSIYHAPCSTIMLGSYDGRLCLCDWTGGWHSDSNYRRLFRMLGTTFEEGACDVNSKAAAQLDEYFGGVRRQFDLPLLLCGTPFQKEVWTALRHVGYGSTMSYARLAATIDRSKAVRAVANAVGANPMSVIIPCHRITGSDNSLTGYGGGLDVKRYLLALEQGCRAEPF